MKKVKNITITRFEHGNFFVDIIESESEFEAWLQGKYNGISSLMFGFPKHQIEDGNVVDVDFDFFCELVDVQLDEYIDDYEAEYM